MANKWPIKSRPVERRNVQSPIKLCNFVGSLYIVTISMWNLLDKSLILCANCFQLFACSYIILIVTYICRYCDKINFLCICNIYFRSKTIYSDMLFWGEYRNNYIVIISLIDFIDENKLKVLTIPNYSYNNISMQEKYSLLSSLMVLHNNAYASFCVVKGTY